MSDKVQKTRYLTQLSLMVAIEAVLFFTPLGLIIVPPISITTLHIPVIIAGMLLGVKAGAVLGASFGLMALAKATLSAVSPVDMLFSPFLSGNPLGSIVMCVLTRIALGLLAAVLYMGLKKVIKKQVVAVGITAAVSTMAHTVMVLGSLYLFFSAVPLKAVFATAFAFNGLLETLGAVVISIAIVIPMSKVQNKI